MSPMPWSRGSSGPNPTLRWTAQIDGTAAHGITIFSATGSVYRGDGWGTGSYSSMRFRRHDLASGHEAASFRSFNGLRCCTVLDAGDLLAASDRKLFRLDPLTLEERERWDRRIPRFPDTMAVVGRSVLLANWLDKRVGIVDLDSGRVRRRDGPPMPKILARDRRPLLVGGAPDGGTWTAALTDGTVKRLHATPPARDAALDPSGNILHLLVGIRAQVKPLATSPGPPSRELRLIRLDGELATTSHRLPTGALRVTVGSKSILLGSGSFVMRAAREDRLTWTRWSFPSDHEVVAMDPDEGLVITIRPYFDSSTSEMACWELRT